MFKYLQSKILFRFAALTVAFIVAIGATSLKKGEPFHKSRGNGSRSENLPTALRPHQKPLILNRTFDNDPIRFSMKSNRTQIALGQLVELTITAQYLNLSPALLYTFTGSNSFRLKLILPEGFIRTGGDYADLISTELSPTRSFVAYTVTGYFTQAGAETNFRLLRSHSNADQTSLFVEKARLSLTLVNSAEPVSNRQARESASNPANGNYEGNCDGGHCENLWGWVYDRNNPNTPITIEMLANGQVVGTLTASELRQDLQNAGKGNGQHGFGFALPASVKNGQSQSLSLRVQGSNYILPNSTRTLTCAGSGTSGGSGTTPTNPGTTTPPPANNPSNGSYESSFDGADCGNLWGWVYDRNNPNAPITVEVVANGQVVASFSAAEYRQDLQNAGKGNGQHGFNFTPPASIKNNQSQSLSLRVQGSSYTLVNGPKTIQCAGSGNTGGSTPNPPTSNGCGSGNGLTGLYFNNDDLSGDPVFVRTDAGINFPWGGSSPQPGTINTDGFSIHWIGQVEAPVSGQYTFKTNNDDGTHVWVNREKLINDWNGHPATWQQGGIYLNAGQKYEIRIDFADFGGDAQAQLFWEYPGQGLQIIPACRLYSLGSTVENGKFRFQIDDETVWVDQSGRVSNSTFTTSWPWPRSSITKCPNLKTPKMPRVPKPKNSSQDGGSECDQDGGSGGVSSPPHEPTPIDPTNPNTPQNPNSPIETGGSSNGNGGVSIPNGVRIPTTAFLDNVDCNGINGWAFAKNGGYADLDIFVNGNKVATITANNDLRPDVRASYGGDTKIPLNCGFKWTIPDDLKSSFRASLNINVVPVNDMASITNSPKTTSEACIKPGTGTGSGGQPFEPSIIPNPSNPYFLNILSEEKALMEPLIKYPYNLRAEYEQKYPKFTQLLRDLKRYALSSDRIKIAIRKYTGLSDDKIRSHLTYGQGPELVISTRPQNTDWGHGGYTYGEYDAVGYRKKIWIDEFSVEMYERGQGLTNLEEAWRIYLSMLVVHEYAHYGATEFLTIDNVHGPNGDNQPGSFNIEAFGVPSTPSGGILVYYLNKLRIKGK